MATRTQANTANGSLEPALEDMAFPGCITKRMTASTHVDFYEYPLEFWDARTETAWELRDGPSPEHEIPIGRLAHSVSMIAAVRGSHIKASPSPGLLRVDAAGRLGYVAHADLVIWLDPRHRGTLGGHGYTLGDPDFPSVVLEVDHTTDIRRGKLKVYESWGIPELWVEVPDTPSPSRPTGLEPGLTIRLLENGAYRFSPTSLAFPGWRTDEIHRALNERIPSAATYAVLERLGRVLGSQSGTGPDDNPLMRSLRDETREAGREEGRMEGRRDAALGLLREMLRTRGIDVSPGFPGNVPGIAGAPESALVGAAMQCASESDFRTRLGL